MPGTGPACRARSHQPAAPRAAGRLRL